MWLVTDLVLPGDVVLHYAGPAEFRRTDGTPVEGTGVEPDVPFEPTREKIARGVYGDPYLDPLVRRAAESAPSRAPN